MLIDFYFTLLLIFPDKTFYKNVWPKLYDMSAFYFAVLLVSNMDLRIDPFVCFVLWKNF